MTLLRLFSSCNPLLKITGKIISDKTELPIEGAEIEFLDNSSSPVNKLYTKNYTLPFFTNKDGYFTAITRLNKIKLDLSKYQIRITKIGYQSLETSIISEKKNGMNIIRLAES